MPIRRISRSVHGPTVPAGRHRAAPTLRRRAGLLATVTTLAVTALAAFGASAPAGAATGQVIPTTPDKGTVTNQHVPYQVLNTTGVLGVVAYNTCGYPAACTPTVPHTVEHNHVTGPVKYAVTPPIGGPHNPTWMNAGVYTKPVPSERAVHDLEHGAVWITYRPGLDATTVQALTDFVAKQTMLSEGNRGPGGTPQANRYIIMSPWTSDAGLPAPIVFSSWGYQLQLSDPSDPRMQQFIDTFRKNSTYTPEKKDAPVDGVAIHVGGNPASNGSLAANPP